ncbi:hypothetical protein [Actinoallomurus sp. NPDC050550]|uniref:hypothetical protein n=1 Tax=Actinoallomurus sp. NPDC050550 TaxID=3154937 RepID=UPI00340AF656
MFYAEVPTRRARQAFTDLLVLAWVGTWTWLAVELYGLVERLATVGDEIQNRTQGIAGNLAATAERLHDLPVVGGEVSGPLNRAATAARYLASAGQTERHLVHDLAVLLVILVLLGPVALATLSWLPRRARWARAAGTAARLRHHPAGVELLALRALANQPLRRLAGFDADQLAAWRGGQPAAVNALAGLELRRLGLRRGAISR